jgi:nicotinamide-nucleotide adenylyltransferase
MTVAGTAPRGLLVGRFQPFHKGHLAVVQAIRAAHPEEELILAIGSAQASFTRENPFTAAERYEMIAAALRVAAVTGCLVLPLPDVRRHAVWVAHTEELLPFFRRVHTNNPLTKRLFERDGYAVEAPAWVHREQFEGRKIREALAQGGDWAAAVTAEVAELIRAYDGPARLRSAPSESTPPEEA